VGTTTIPFLSDSQLDTLALWQGDPWLVRADDKNVAKAGSKGVVDSVLDVNDIKTTIVSLAVSDDTNTTHVAATGSHGDCTGIKADEVDDLSGLDINLDSIVDTDGGVRVADGAGIVGNEIWDPLSAQLNTLDLCELVRGLGLGDAVDGETSLGIVDKTEALAGLFDGDNVHEASGKGRVRADFAIDLDETLHYDGLDFSAVESILKSVSNENN